jgi:hypothetical protein
MRRQRKSSSLPRYQAGQDKGSAARVQPLSFLAHHTGDDVRDERKTAQDAQQRA